MNVRIVIPVALAIVGGIWGFNRWSFAQTHESTDNAQVDGHIVPVVAKVGGYVLTVHVGENAPVADNGVLVSIDEREYRVKLAQAEADYAAAVATSGSSGLEGQAAAMVRTASSQRDVGDAQVLAARAQVVKAQSDLARAKELSAKQIISMAQLDAAQAAFDAASAQLTATQRGVNAATSGVSNAEAGVRIARARLAASRSRLLPSCCCWWWPRSGADPTLRHSGAGWAHPSSVRPSQSWCWVACWWWQARWCCCT